MNLVGLFVGLVSLFLSAELSLCDVEPVKVEVYLESYCPDSKRFFLNHLVPTFEAFKDDNILDVTVVPYGKARVINVVVKMLV